MVDVSANEYMLSLMEQLTKRTSVFIQKVRFIFHASSDLLKRLKSGILLYSVFEVPFQFFVSDVMASSGVTEGVRWVRSHCPREKSCPFKAV